jgi:hypothetical protein
MDISFATPGKGPDIVAVLGLAANIVAVLATSAIAVFSIWDSRRAKDKDQRNNLYVAYLGVLHAMEMMRGLFENPHTRPDRAVRKETARGILKLCQISIDDAFDRGISDPHLYAFALNARAMIVALSDDIDQTTTTHWNPTGTLLNGELIEQEGTEQLDRLRGMRGSLGLGS